jgi:hypothetical protein
MSGDISQTKRHKQNNNSVQDASTLNHKLSMPHVKPTIFSGKTTRDEASNAHFLYVLSKIKPDILITLTKRQIEGIRQAVAEKHPVDYRFSFPLWFIKMYIVVAIGRDRRSSTVLKEKHRRVFSYLCGVLGGVYALLCLMAPVMLILLYLLKTWLNIDYFENFHLTWIFEDW